MITAKELTISILIYPVKKAEVECNSANQSKSLTDRMENLWKQQMVLGTLPIASISIYNLNYLLVNRRRGKHNICSSHY
jgi:hypothetical protein